MKESRQDGHDLEGVRSELRRLGYLDHGFERFLLQDALRRRQPVGALLRLTGKVGMLAGLILSLALAFALAVANGNLTESPLDLLFLFLHLFLPISVVTGLVFLALCGVVLLVIRLYHVRRIETLSLATAAVAGAAGLALAVQVGREVLAGGNLWHVALLAAATPVVLYALIKLVYHGLLTLAIRFTDEAPLGRIFTRRWLTLAVLSAAVLLTLPAVVSARRGGPAAAPATLPTAAGERVVLLGIDGILPEEVDYLLALGDLPAMGRLAYEGRVLRYSREAEPPASFWTAVATGVPGPDHGVTALDSFLPLGVKTSLARTGPLRLFFSGIEVPLGLAEYRAVLANRRQAFTVWELASRGGAPALAVNWWATYPAEPLPGLVVAHGAYQLLGERAAGAVAPETARPTMAALTRAAASAPVSEGPQLRAALPAAQVASLFERALRPDAFYRAAFARGLAVPAPRPSTCRPWTSRPRAGTAGTWRSPIWCARSSGPPTGSSREPWRRPARWPWCWTRAGGGRAARGGSSSGAAARAAAAEPRVPARRSSRPLPKRWPRGSCGRWASPRVRSSRPRPRPAAGRLPRSSSPATGSRTA
jgi:hypothetical protein